MEVFLAMMVIPFSRSRSIESITRSATCSLARKIPLCQSIASTSVVLPWSTWAMMARLRTSSLVWEFKRPLVLGEKRENREKFACPAGAGRISQAEGAQGSGFLRVGRLGQAELAQGGERPAHRRDLLRLEVGELATGADPGRDLLPRHAVPLTVD